MKLSHSVAVLALCVLAVACGDDDGPNDAPSAPVLQSLSPAAGSVSGGTSVVLTGIHLDGVFAVAFGDTPAAAFTIDSSTQITAQTPARAAGTVNVSVASLGGGATLTSVFRFVQPGEPEPEPVPPVLSGIVPNSGGVAGGTSVVISGTALSGASAVTFGGSAATSFTVDSDTQITAQTPAHAIGSVDVVVTTLAGSATLANAFTYDGPTVSAISPSSGSASGQTGFTLTGTGFTGATSVLFDGVPAVGLNVVSSTQVTGVTPAHAAGAADIRIETPLGAAVVESGFAYLVTAIGQATAGGTIAGLSGGVLNLVAATADNSGGIAWGGFGTATGASSNLDGATNTSTIVNALGNGAYAAQLCDSFEVDSQGNTPCTAGNVCYNDWFAPAADQLDTLFINRVAVGGFASAMYWSSTEVNANQGVAFNFDASGSFLGAKAALYNLRCVRVLAP